MDSRLTVAARLASAAVLLGAIAASPAAAQTSIFSAGGSGVAGSSGDAGPATLAALNYPRGLTALPDGGFLVTEAYGNRVRRVAPDGTITAFAGSGVAGFGGDGGAATAARLNMPHGAATLPDGSVLIADTNNFRIRRVALDGKILTVAGTGTRSFSGDGGPATAARISAPRGIGGAPDGGYLIADSDNNRIRRVSPSGIITTIAGTGTRGFSGDGGTATAATLNAPYGVSALADGTIYIADQGNNAIRRIAPDGTITTVAGTGSAGFSGDGGPATLAKLSGPHAVEALPDGRILIADTWNSRIRTVAPDGTITTIVGTGAMGFSGEAGAPLTASLFYPKALLSLASGLLVADADNYRVRFVGGSPWPTPALGSGIVFVNGAQAYSNSTLVSVGVPADGVTQVRVSNSPALADGVLASGTTYPYGTPLAWNLADAAAGGSGANGNRLVYVQWDRGGGVWSPVVADSIVLDTVAPQATPPVAAFPTGATINATTVPVNLAWSGSDATSGVGQYQLQLSVNGGASKTLTTTAATANHTLSPGADYTYGVRATDLAGNTGSWASAAPLRLTLSQESDPAVVLSGSWTSEPSSAASGGSVVTTTDPIGTATFTFTGRTLAWVAPVGPASGAAKVDIDGVNVATVNLKSTSNISRRIVYSAKWANAREHTLTIRNAGTGATRIDLDALVVGS